MTSLYDDGWRQGSIFESNLPLPAVMQGASGRPELTQATHGRWVVASQDCDLDRAASGETEPCIELRPVYTETPPADWGIRSARLLLTTHDYVISATPRLHVAPATLTALLQGDVSLRDPGTDRRRAFTTWLGLRYDRPAVPAHLVPLARRISNEVAQHRHRPVAAHVRDVLMQFDDSTSPVRFSLFAVLDNATDEDPVRKWLAEVAVSVPNDLGIADQLEAATADGIAFSTIEQSYAADVTQVTWRPGQPGPDGAT